MVSVGLVYCRKSIYKYHHSVYHNSHDASVGSGSISDA